LVSNAERVRPLESARFRPRWLDLTTGSVRELGAHLDNVDALEFSPSGDRLASGSADDSVLVWDVR
jgi:WD40 repeat protein